MAVIDLYTPRIQEEGLRERHKVDVLVNTLQEASKQLFQYSVNKQEIDKAYAEIEARAQAERDKAAKEKADKADELKYSRWSTTALAGGLIPYEKWTPEMKQVLDDRFYETTGMHFPKGPDGQPEITKDVVDNLSMMVLDKEGKLTPQALTFYANSKTPQSDVGKIMGDIQIAKERGLTDDDPEMVALYNNLRSKTTTQFGEEQARYIDYVWKTSGPEAARAQIMKFLEAGKSGGTNVKVVLPGEKEREDVIKARGTLQGIRDLKAMWAALKASGINPVGFGKENIHDWVGLVMNTNPRVKAFYAQVNKLQADMVRIQAGLAQTDTEVARQQGYIMRNNLPMQQFEAALDINEQWAIKDLNNRLQAGGEFGQKVPSAVPEPDQPLPTEKPEDIGKPKSGARKENQSGATQADQGDQQKLEALEAKIRALEAQKKAAERRGGKTRRGAVEPQSAIDPRSYMFNQAMTRGIV